MDLSETAPYQIPSRDRCRANWFGLPKNTRYMQFDAKRNAYFRLPPIIFITLNHCRANQFGLLLASKMTILHSFSVIQNVVVVKRGKAEAFCWLCQMCSVWVQAFAFSMQPPQHLDFAYEWLSGGFGRSPTLNCARPQNFAVLAKQRISKSFTFWILRTSRFKMDAAN